MFHQNKNIFNILFEAIPEGALVVNNNSLIVFANTAVENMFGYNNGELKNQNLNVLIPKKHSLQRIIRKPK